MKLIWAFKFSKSKDPATKQYRVYDLNDFVKVSGYSVLRVRRLRICPGYLDGSE